MITPTDRAGASSANSTKSARGLLLSATLVCAVLYLIPGAHFALYPFVLLTTIIHEGGHALMTMLTGGSVLSIGINPDGSGVTYSSSGIPGLIYMAGYLGATLFGAIALHVGRRKGMGRRSLQLVGGLVLAVT